MRPSEMPPGPSRQGGSQRRMRPPQPSSPSSDAEMDPEPPVDRQSSRPIFGGIAKMVRNPSGSSHAPPTHLVTSLLHRVDFDLHACTPPPSPFAN